MRKILAVFAVLAMVFNITMTTYAATLEEKKAELEDLQQQLETKDAEREAKKKDVKSAIEQLMAVQNELAKAQKELDVVEERQKVLNGKIKKNESDIKKKIAELEITKKLYCKRLRNIYENGQINYLDVLLGAKDFSDFSSRMFLLQRIIQKDSEMLELLKTQKATLETEKQTLADNKKQLEVVHKEVAAKKKVVEEKTAQRRAIYDKALAEQKRIDEEYDKLLEESNNVTNMIKNWEAVGTMGSVHGSGQFIWPCSGTITSPFGWRTHPIFGTSRFHSGMDIGVDYGTPICAADSGTVVYADWMGGYGNAVMIDHGGGLVTLYGHNSSLSVGVGQTVSQGQQIALAGSTGYSTGPHCHFEVRIHGEVTDPSAYLP